MKLPIVVGVLLLDAFCSLVAHAQDEQRSKVEYVGAKFTPVHWILSVAEQGKTVVLEDSSVWQICPSCRQAARRLRPGTVVSTQDRGDTYRFPYLLRILSDGQRSYPLNAACMKNPGATIRVRSNEGVAEQR